MSELCENLMLGLLKVHSFYLSLLNVKIMALMLDGYNEWLKLESKCI